MSPNPILLGHYRQLRDSGNGYSCGSRLDNLDNLSSIESSKMQLEEDPRSLSLTSLDIEKARNEEDNDDKTNDNDKAAKAKMLFKLAVKIVCVLLYNVYIVYSIYYHKSNGLELDWCGGLGFLLVMTGIVYLVLFYMNIVKPLVGRPGGWCSRLRMPDALVRLLAYRYSQLVFVLVTLVAVVIFLIVDTGHDRYRIIILSID